MRIIKDTKNIDIKNKMYVKLWGDIIYVLKHIVLKHKNKTEFKYRWISMDGREFYNVLLFIDDMNLSMMFDSPKLAISTRWATKNTIETIYEFDDLTDLFENWKEMMENYIKK